MRYPKQSTIKRLLSYDSETGAFLWKSRPDTHRGAAVFNSRFAGKMAGTDRSGYLVIRIHEIPYRAHRLAWIYINGDIQPNMQIDHINGNRRDNRMENLRLVTAGQNRKNQKLQNRNTSGVIGVRWDASRKKWLAQIGSDGKTVNLGRFDSKDAAIRARKAAEVEYGFHENHGRD